MPSTTANTMPASVGCLVSGAHTQRERSHLQQSVHRKASAPNARLALLAVQHADLDLAISALLQTGNCDDLLITRLKKRKLQIKDEIAGMTPSPGRGDDALRQEMISCVA